MTTKNFSISIACINSASSSSCSSQSICLPRFVNFSSFFASFTIHHHRVDLQQEIAEFFFFIIDIARIYIILRKYGWKFFITLCQWHGMSYLLCGGRWQSLLVNIKIASCNFPLQSIARQFMLIVIICLFQASTVRIIENTNSQKSARKLNFHSSIASKRCIYLKPFLLESTRECNLHRQHKLNERNFPLKTFR